MTPFEVANSDALKVQLQETGEVFVYLGAYGYVDDYVDAIRTMAADLGLGNSDLVMTMWSDQRIHVQIAVAATKTGRKMTNADFEALADEAELGYDVSHLLTKDNR